MPTADLKDHLSKKPTETPEDSELRANLKGLLEASYDKGITDVNGYKQDKSLSTGKTKVFVNDEGKTVVAHRGTDSMQDWSNNLAYAVGGNALYKTTDRYKQAKRIQRQAEKKYGRENVSTVGHSQGGLQAELLGKKGSETITYNKASRPFTNVPSKNQTDIRTSNDLVSSLNTNKKGITIKSKSSNPLKEHSLQRLR